MGALSQMRVAQGETVFCAVCLDSLKRVAHQRTQVVAGGAVIPGLAEPFLVLNRPVTQVKPAQAAIKSIVNNSLNDVTQAATRVAQAASAWTTCV